MTGSLMPTDAANKDADSNVTRVEMTASLAELIGRGTELRMSEHSALNWNLTGSVRSLATLRSRFRR
jgi:hypothetical protein